MAAKRGSQPAVVAGDIYAGPVLDGRYGAVRVVQLTKRRRGALMVLVCTPYLDAEPPAMDDPALRKVLRRKHGFRNYLAVQLCDRPPPESFIYIGNRPPTKRELAIDAHGNYADEWYLIEHVLTEWRWVHEREAMEQQRAAWIAEAEAETHRPKPPPGPRPRTPRSTLTERDFWALLGRLGVTEATDAVVEVAPLVAALARRGQADLREFHELLAEKLYALDGKRYADHAGAAGSSGDGFLDARCHVVARGERFYQDVLAHPERFPADASLEDLLTVAPEAFARRSTDDFEEDTHYSIETGANAAGWA